MRRLDNLKSLRRILEVRKAQRLAAETRVQQAAAHQRTLDETREDSLVRLREAKALWSELVSGPSLSLQLAGVWSMAIRNQETDLSQLDQRIGEAKRGAADKRLEWRAARMRVDVATDLAGSAAKQVRRLQEETRLNDLADRFAQRRAGR